MGIYHAKIGMGLYLYQIKAKSLKEAKIKTKKMLINNEKIIYVVKA